MAWVQVPPRTGFSLKKKRKLSWVYCISLPTSLSQMGDYTCIYVHFVTVLFVYLHTCKGARKVLLHIKHGFP